MTFEIDQETLCDYCEANNDNISRDRCEGNSCNETRLAYLEYHGITENNEGIIFRGLTVGDIVYKLNKKDITPSLRTLEVKGISVGDAGLRINLHYEYVTITKVSTDKEGDYYLHKKDGEKALTELCISRITRLSKVIGSCESIVS